MFFFPHGQQPFPHSNLLTVSADTADTLDMAAAALPGCDITIHHDEYNSSTTVPSHHSAFTPYQQKQKCPSRLP